VLCGVVFCARPVVAVSPSLGSVPISFVLVAQQRPEGLFVALCGRDRVDNGAAHVPHEQDYVLRRPHEGDIGADLDPRQTAT
jgi:hypothetical protein